MELDILIDAIKQGDEKKAVLEAERLLGVVEPREIINGLTTAMRQLGELFEKKEIFIPELLIAADALLEVMDVVKPHLGENSEKKMKVILGTVAGDIHEIGKNIVNIVLTAEGYEVIDLGTDVSVRQFIDKAEEVEADVIGLSTLMTTTMNEQKMIVEQLKAENKRDKYLVIIGGAPTSEKWAEKIEADAYCKDAFVCARYLNSLQFPG